MNNPRAAKVLSLSSVITSIGVIVGFIIMFSLSLESDELTPLAIIVGLLSILPFYWLSVLVSGFAELIEKNSNIEEMTKEQLFSYVDHTQLKAFATWADICDAYERPCVFIQIKYTTGLDGHNILILKEHDVKMEYSDEFDNGEVIGTTPAAGERVTIDTKVVIIVSKGAEKSEVPNLVGKTVSEAQKLLADAKLTDGGAVEEYNNVVEAGKIISQSVKHGKKVDAGTSVSYVVSKGKEPAKTVKVAFMSA